MRVFKFTIPNKDIWRITDTELVILAEDKKTAKELLIQSGYHIEKTGNLIELNKGVHLIQDMITE